MGRRVRLNERQLRRIVSALLKEQAPGYDGGPGKLGVGFFDPVTESNSWLQDEDEAGYGDGLNKHYDDLETYGPYDGDVLELPEDSEAYEDSEAEDMEEPDPDLASAQYYDRRY
jgi:hypothetical protein